MKLYEAVARVLIDSGTERIFGLMGDGNMRYIAAYRDSQAGGYVATAHEGAAVSMADGYWRMSGRLGVATITHGPAVTNALTALGEAARARSAIVVMTSDTMPQREHRQWLDLRAAAHVSGAAYREVHSAASAADDIVLALRLAYTLRQPVLLNIPSALISDEIEYSPSVFGTQLPEPQAIAPDADQLDAALGLIASSDRPVILAGRGAVLAKARKDLIALAKTLQAPAATTVLAMEYFAGYDLNLGIFGTESHSLATRYLSQADCVIVVGAGLNTYTTLSGDLLKGKAVVQCDNDLLALASRYPPTVSVHADARVFVQQVDAALRELGLRPPSAWAARLREELRTFNATGEFIDKTGVDTIDARTAMIALDRVLPDDRIVVTDNGRFKTAPWRYLRCSPGDFTHSGAFGSIGLAVATAIGASIGSPERLTVAIVGDGGLMQGGILELTAAVDHHLPLLVAVVNDGSYGSEYKKLSELGHDPRYSLKPWPPLAGVAQALGARGVTITRVDEIEKLESDFRNLREPMLLDIKADPAVDSRKYR